MQVITFSSHAVPNICLTLIKLTLFTLLNLSTYKQEVIVPVITVLFIASVGNIVLVLVADVARKCSELIIHFIPDIVYYNYAISRFIFPVKYL